jgi:AAA domain-containing protein
MSAFNADDIGAGDEFVSPEPEQGLPPVKFAFRPSDFVVPDTAAAAEIRTEVVRHLDYRSVGVEGKIPSLIRQHRDRIVAYATESLYLLDVCGMLDDPIKSIDSAVETFERLIERGHSRVSATIDRADLLLSEWLKRELPPRDFLLGELLSTTSRWIVYGETGVGKTLWALDLIAAVGTGKSFLHWEGSGRRRRIMYLDGELPAETFKERLQIIAERYGDDVELYAYNRDVLVDGEMPPLNTPRGMAWLRREIESVDPDAIVFDSIMCLLEGTMSEEESWAPIKAEIRKISGWRIAQIWLHHTGHDNSKGFGTKTREWEMDTVIALTSSGDDDGSILMEFKKARLRKPETRDQFESKKLLCGRDGWEIVGGGTKGATARGVSKLERLRRAFVEAYHHLANDVEPTLGKDRRTKVRKVPIGAISDYLINGEMLENDRQSQKDFNAVKQELLAPGPGRKFIADMGQIWALHPEQSFEFKK